jgi:hypothetical protein
MQNSECRRQERQLQKSQVSEQSAPSGDKTKTEVDVLKGSEYP